MLSVELARARARLASWHAAGVEAVRPDLLLPRFASVEAGVWTFRRDSRVLALPLPGRPTGGRLRVVAIGKAARAMAVGFQESMGGHAVGFEDGLIVARDPVAGEPPWREICGDHPLPGVRSERAAQELLRFIDAPTAADAFVVLLSGGASALCALPRDGVTLAEKRDVTLKLMHSGASIAQINRMRIELSAIKGGKLLRWMRPARVVTLAVSDVRDDDPAVIGSGPTFDPPRSPCVVMASIGDAIAGVSAAAAASGVEVRSLGASLYGRVHDEAVRLVTTMLSVKAPLRPRLWVAGGEPVLSVRGSGRGGRAQELALCVAREIATRAADRRIAGLSAGTDGTDGPTDAAGGFFDSSSMIRASLAGIDVDSALTNNDSYTVLHALGDHYCTGPTGTNVTDLVLALELPS